MKPSFANVKGNWIHYHYTSSWDPLLGIQLTSASGRLIWSANDSICRCGPQSVDVHKLCVAVLDHSSMKMTEQVFNVLKRDDFPKPIPYLYSNKVNSTVSFWRSPFCLHVMAYTCYTQRFLRCWNVLQKFKCYDSRKRFWRCRLYLVRGQLRFNTTLWSVRLDGVECRTRNDGPAVKPPTCQLIYKVTTKSTYCFKRILFSYVFLWNVWKITYKLNSRIRIA